MSLFLFVAHHFQFTLHSYPFIGRYVVWATVTDCIYEGGLRNRSIGKHFSYTCIHIHRHLWHL